MTWMKIGPLAGLHFADGACVKVAGRELAVFRNNGGYVALDNNCPHQGGPLAEGYVEQGRIACPWHGWSFELSTGQCNLIPEHRVQVFATRVVEGVLEVDVP